MSEEEENPPMIIQTNTSASHSLTSSIGKSEFGMNTIQYDSMRMNTAKKGNETTFCIAV